MNVSRGKTMKNAYRTSLIKQVNLIIICVEYMLSSSDHVKGSETKWQYRKTHIY